LGQPPESWIHRRTLHRKETQLREGRFQTLPLMHNSGWGIRPLRRVEGRGKRKEGELRTLQNGKRRRKTDLEKDDADASIVPEAFKATARGNL